MAIGSWSSAFLRGPQARWVFDHFWNAYDSVASLPDVCPIGFATTYLASLVLMPVILYVVLSMVWSLAAVGSARKCMSTFFILLLGVPLYPVLTAVSLLAIWLVLGVLGVALATLGPIFAVAFLWQRSLVAKKEFIEQQRELDPSVNDITCIQMLLGLFMGILCLCTVGLLTFSITILKMPVLVMSGFCQAWWRAGRAWLELINGRERSGNSSESSEDVDNGSCFWWYWFPLVLVAWLVFVALGVCVVILVVLISALVKLIASVVWPAYVTAGWLRYFGSEGTRRRSDTCWRSAIVDGLKAGYQVLWASDVLTNAFIIGDPKRLVKACEQFKELAKGQRDALDGDCQRLSCLPPVVLGLFGPSWDLASHEAAKKLGISQDKVEEAWRSLAQLMIRLGREGVDDGLLTREWVQEVPAELCIGLPARAMLDTVERSLNDGELVLACGLVFRNDTRPKGEFFDKVWGNLMLARRKRAEVSLTTAERDALCAALLAGGGKPEGLPDGLAAGVRRFEELPQATHAACRDILRGLVACSVECSRRRPFKEKLQVTIECIADETGGRDLLDDLVRRRDTPLLSEP
uniref:Uncharacterized protein n=1 Tax=Alexandrium monilatum TaxID=311494 RepID=A0A7S4PXP8_9DINO|mmetsp:Transcript_106179/g.317191  ORF Transcript_106179/g.317191 Transcript_106179/m.317191 type:complete len:578 (+) Transcript_106179:75-1808(+)